MTAIKKDKPCKPCKGTGNVIQYIHHYPKVFVCYKCGGTGVFVAKEVVK